MTQYPSQSVLFFARGGAFHGSQRQLLYLLEALDKTPFTPVVVCDRKGDFTDALTAREIVFYVIPLRQGGRPWQRLRPCGHTRKLIELARRHEVELVHCSYLWMSRYMKIIARQLAIPAILHIRKPLTPRQVRKYRCRAADRLIAISPRCKAGLLNAGLAEETIRVISDGVDLAIYHPTDSPRDDEAFTIGLAGRISAQKFQLEFLAAAAMFAKQSPRPVRIRLAGQVREAEYKTALIEFAAAHGLGESVEFLDYVEQMGDYLNTLDVLVSLSGGSVMYEAMACGTAVLSAGFTPRGFAMHLRDGETARCLDSREPKAIAAALGELAENPQIRNTFAQQGLAEARAHLGCDIMAQKTIALYRSLLTP
jgi:glycosyltransferase involved in cell wall biosynthesis